MSSSILSEERTSSIEDIASNKFEGVIFPGKTFLGLLGAIMLPGLSLGSLLIQAKLQASIVAINCDVIMYELST